MTKPSTGETVVASPTWGSTLLKIWALDVNTVIQRPTEVPKLPLSQGKHRDFKQLIHSGWKRRHWQCIELSNTEQWGNVCVCQPGLSCLT